MLEVIPPLLSTAELAFQVIDPPPRYGERPSGCAVGANVLPDGRLEQVDGCLGRGISSPASGNRLDPVADGAGDGDRRVAAHGGVGAEQDLELVVGGDRERIALTRALVGSAGRRLGRKRARGGAGLGLGHLERASERRLESVAGGDRLLLRVHDARVGVVAALRRGVHEVCKEVVHRGRRLAGFAGGPAEQRQASSSSVRTSIPPSSDRAIGHARAWTP